MKKFERWRRPSPDVSPAATPAVADAASVTADPALQAAPSEDSLEDALKALRQAAMLQHEETVPAAFYRGSVD